MAKKKSSETENSKTRMALRFEPEVYDNLKAIADDAQLSVNQLMQGIAKNFLSHAHSGEPRRDENGKVVNKRQIGCVWFGKQGSRPEEYDRHMADNLEMSLEEYERKYLKGEIWMELDFTERKVVKRDL